MCWITRKSRLESIKRANKIFPKWSKCKSDQSNYYKSVILHLHNNRNKSCMNPQNPGCTMFVISLLTKRIPSFLSGYPNSCLYKKYIWLINAFILLLYFFFYWKYIFSSVISLEINFHEIYPGCVHAAYCFAYTQPGMNKCAKENLKVHAYGLH